MNLTTKGDIVRLALRKLALASNAVLADVEPASMEDAVNDLEAMMAQWLIDGGDTGGVDVGYLFAGDGEAPHPDDDHGMPTFAILPVALNLACTIDSDYSIQVPQSIITKAENGYEICVRYNAKKKLPRLTYRNRVPTGSGNLLLKQLGINYFHNPAEISEDDDDAAN